MCASIEADGVRFVSTMTTLGMAGGCEAAEGELAEDPMVQVRVAVVCCRVMAVVLP